MKAAVNLDLKINLVDFILCLEYGGLLDNTTKFLWGELLSQVKFTYHSGFLC